MIIVLQLATAVLSAFLNNVTTVLLIVPVTLAITKEIEVCSYPFLFAEIFASNIGGTATLIGDPPNILIGSLAGLDFNAFIVHLAPIIILVMAAQLLMIQLIWGRNLKSTPEHEARVMAIRAADAIEDWLLLKQSLAVIGVVMLCFVMARPLHLDSDVRCCRALHQMRTSLCEQVGPLSGKRNSQAETDAAIGRPQ
jgi:Na+/H+ antiporter NhaD/arsenite permease-like protein